MGRISLGFESSKAEISAAALPPLVAPLCFCAEVWKRTPAVTNAVDAIAMVDRWRSRIIFGLLSLGMQSDGLVY
jgi:hypothetical protein